MERVQARIQEETALACEHPLDFKTLLKRMLTFRDERVVACPVCGQGKVAENSKGFYCTRFREGCKFTIWKDALTRVGGPMLNAKLLKLCMEKKDVRGSTGTIHYDAGQIRFSPGER